MDINAFDVCYSLVVANKNSSIPLKSRLVKRNNELFLECRKLISSWSLIRGRGHVVHDFLKRITLPYSTTVNRSNFSWMFSHPPITSIFRSMIEEKSMNYRVIGEKTVKEGYWGGDLRLRSIGSPFSCVSLLSRAWLCVVLALCPASLSSTGN